LAARSFLFAEDNTDVALTRFIGCAATTTGFMDGAPGDWQPGLYQIGRDNRAVLETLYARLEQAYPHAGQPFYAVRLWTNLVWQPAYLAVIAVHVHGALPDLGRLSQAIKGIHVSGYRLPPGPQVEAPRDALIAEAGTRLRAMADAILRDINAVTRLKRLPALRLLTDRMLGLMVRLNPYQPGITVAEQQRVCALWLKAMGLTGHGDLDILTLHDGTEVPIIARKGCCLDYLAFPDTYCISCPKQDDAVRIARQRDNAMAERSAAG
jgi:siderophore ferric iron reductase